MNCSAMVATARNWYAEYGRTVKPGARALVILQPMGPVMFVFDVSDTERGEDAQDLPSLVEQPFGARGGNVAHTLAQTIENAARDGIRLVPGDTGSQSAGCIQTTSTSGKLSFLVKTRPEPEYVDVPIHYDMLITTNITTAAGKYAILVHELAHLYCGHLGSPNERFWSRRTGMPEKQREFEAESVAYMLCRRCGIEMTSHRYLSLYFDGRSRVTSQVPNISLECVLKSAGLIEQMGKRRLPPRKEKKGKATLAT